MVFTWGLVWFPFWGPFSCTSKEVSFHLPFKGSACSFWSPFRSQYFSAPSAYQAHSRYLSFRPQALFPASQLLVLTSCSRWLGLTPSPWALPLHWKLPTSYCRLMAQPNQRFSLALDIRWWLPWCHQGRVCHSAFVPPLEACPGRSLPFKPQLVLHSLLPHTLSWASMESQTCARQWEDEDRWDTVTDFLEL